MFLTKGRVEYDFLCQWWSGPIWRRYMISASTLESRDRAKRPMAHGLEHRIAIRELHLCHYHRTKFSQISQTSIMHNAYDIKPHLSESYSSLPDLSMISTMCSKHCLPDPSRASECWPPRLGCMPTSLGAIQGCSRLDI